MMGSLMGKGKQSIQLVKVLYILQGEGSLKTAMGLYMFTNIFLYHDYLAFLKYFLYIT